MSTQAAVAVADDVRQPPDGLPKRSRGRRKHPRAARYVRRGLLVVGVLLIPVTWSYAGALTGPGTDSWQERSVEWGREHHLGPLVDHFERSYYASHQAKVGGQPSTKTHLGVSGRGAAAPTAPRGGESALPVGADPALPYAQPSATTPAAAPVTASTVFPPVVTGAPAEIPTTAAAATAAPPRAAAGPANPPAPLSTPAPTPVAGEGQWTGIGPSTNGRFGVYATLLRPDAVHTSVLDAVVYIDPTIVSLRQYPGVKVPGAPWDRPDYVETDRRPGLIAAFEGGFRLQDSRGGMMLGGTTLQKMRDGAATLAIDPNGVPNIGMWGRDFSQTTALDSARQNLDLIVDGGVVNPDLATDPHRKWGFTGPAAKDAVWRSGLGITADGALVWVGGDGLGIQALAETLQRAGAVRAMQMDINHDWVQFNTYAVDAGGNVHGQLLLQAMRHSGDRYLSTDTRDFVAVFAR